MKISTLLSNFGMVGTASIANHLGYVAFEKQVDSGSTVPEIAGRTFENSFIPHAMQKIAQIIGNKLLGNKIGSALSSYSTALIYMLFHKAMTADVNHEVKVQHNSYVPKAIRKLYGETVRPGIKFMQEKVFGIKDSVAEGNKETKPTVNWFNMFLANGAILGSTFLDKNVAFPGTEDVRNADSFLGKLYETIKNKLAYMFIYYFYQGSTILMYSSKEKNGESIGKITTKLKNGMVKAIKTKSVPPLSISIADPVAEIINSYVPKILPSPIIAAVLRVTLMFGGGRLQNYLLPVKHENESEKEDAKKLKTSDELEPSKNVNKKQHKGVLSA